MAVGDQARPHAEHEGVGHVAEEGHEGEVRCDEALGPDLEVLLAEMAKATAGEVFVNEGLRLADTRQALLEVRVDDRDPLPGEVVGARRLAPEHNCRERERYDHAQGHEGKPPVQEEEGDPDTDEGAHGDECREEPVFYQRLELIHVRGHPGHDPARHLALVVVEGEALQLRPDTDAQRHHYPLGGAAGDERRPDLVDQVRERDYEVYGRGNEHDGFRARGDAFVDALFDEHRPGKRRESVQSDEHEAEAQRSPVLSEEPTEAEMALMARLCLDIDAWEVAHRPQGGDSGQQLRSGREVEAPPAAGSQSRPHAGGDGSLVGGGRSRLG